MSLAKSILSTVTSKEKEIEIKEWSKDKFKLRELNSRQRDQYGYDATQNPADFARGFNVRIIIDTLHDSEGNQVFSQSDAKELSNQSGTLLARIAKQSQELSGLSEDAVDEAEKN